ncbi:MAG: metallophosphoesterase [bacterium]
MRRAAGLALLLILLPACLGPATTTSTSTSPVLSNPIVRFVALGDAGTGEADQFTVAAAIAKVCAERGCDFAVGLGDNIYDAGASSDRDPQFDSKFEVPYANLAMPFWMVLGNHDNSQDPAASGATGGLGLWYSAGNNEVAYGKRTDTSGKWHMPARYYTFTQGPAAFVALDTNTLLFDDVPVPPGQAAEVQAQTKWVDGAIAALPANTTWRIAIGHHGYLSNGPHGNAGAYDGRAGVPGQSGDYTKQFFEAHVCDKVDLYLFGHDHDLQWLDAVAPCGRTQFIGSGAGGAGTYELVGTNAGRFQASEHGFWYFEVDAKNVYATAYDADGKILYTGVISKHLAA